MLAHHRVIFAENELFRLGAGVFLGYVVVASVSGADQFDLDGSCFCHIASLGSFAGQNTGPTIIEFAVAYMV